MLSLLFSCIVVFALAKLEVSPEGQYLKGPASVTFKSDLINPQFRYTTSWKTLTTRASKTFGTLWNGSPIQITGNTILTVVHFNGTVYDPSDWQSHTYVFFNTFVSESEFTRKPNLTAALNQIPLVSITHDKTIPEISAASPTVPAAVELLHPTDPKERWFYFGGVKYSGNYNVYLEKKSYRLYFSKKDYGGQGKFSEDIYAKYSGTQKDKISRAAHRFENVQFRSGSADCIVWMEWEGRGYNYPGSYATLIRNAFGDELQLQMGHWSAHTRFYHLIDNGRYYGVYHARERVDSNYLADYVGGLPEDYEFNNHCTIRDGNGTLFTKLQATKNSYESFSKWADVQNLVDYMILQQFNLNFDVNSCWNWQGYGPYTGIIDGGFQFYGSDIDISLLNPTQPLWEDGPFGCWKSLWLEHHPDFVQLFHDRLYKHFNHDGVLTPSNMQATWRYLAAQIDQAVEGEAARWGTLTYQGRFTKDRWNQGINWVLNNWLSGSQSNHYFQEMRTRNRMYPAPGPLFTPLQGKVAAGTTITVANQWAGTTLYCSQDGSDVRNPGGALGTFTLTGSSSITTSAKESFTLTCRSRHSDGRWSPMERRNFIVKNPLLAGMIQITEVSYDALDVHHAEFIEIKNNANVPVSLLGCYFETDRAKYIWTEKGLIQPGKYLVGTNQRAQFRTTYNKQADFWYTGDLKKNSGFKLKDAWDVTIVSIEWKDQAPWPQFALIGYTLVPGYKFNPAASTKARSGRHWRWSKNKKGSPWAEDPLPLLLTIFDEGNHPLVVNEIMQNPPKGEQRWVELRNKGAETLKIGGWSLSDNIDKLNKYKFKAGTEVAAGAFLVLTESDLGFKLNDDALFILDNAGKDYSINLPSKSLKGYSQGRIVVSDGSEQFAHLVSASKGAANNAAPYIPSVVISAVGYGLPTEYANYKYVKLTNLGKKNVVMTGWKVVVGGESYKFEKKGIHDVVLLPGQSVFLLEKGASIDKFRKAFAKQWIDATSIILAVLKANDDDFYDDVKLQQPDDGDEVTVDRIDVGQIPLPKKRAAGPFELTRVTPVGFSLDPRSWTQTTLPAPTPIDCTWGDWTPWTPCYNNQRGRTRPMVMEQFGGKPCDEITGSKQMETGCSNTTDCSWTAWSEWSSCSTTCGSGQMTRSRTEIPAKNGGAPCVGANKIASPCVRVECPVDCEWFPWSEWTSCNTGAAACGNGIRERKRESIPEQFGGAPCEDFSTDYDQCEVACPVSPLPVAPPTGDAINYLAGGNLALVAVFVVFVILIVIVLVAVIALALKTWNSGAYGTGGGYQAY